MVCSTGKRRQQQQHAPLQLMQEKHREAPSAATAQCHPANYPDVLSRKKKACLAEQQRIAPTPHSGPPPRCTPAVLCGMKERRHTAFSVGLLLVHSALFSSTSTHLALRKRHWGHSYKMPLAAAHSKKAPLRTPLTISAHNIAQHLQTTANKETSHSPPFFKTLSTFRFTSTATRSHQKKLTATSTCKRRPDSRAAHRGTAGHAPSDASRRSSTRTTALLRETCPCWSA